MKKTKIRDVKIYAKSMGKIFPVTCVCTTDEEANEFCRKHKDNGVIGVDNNGLIYVADFYGFTCPSALIAD